MEIIYKKDLVDKVKEKFDINKSEASDLIDFIFDEITNSVLEDKKVVITNFAGFKLKDSKVTGKKHFSCIVSTNLKKRIKELA
ncbi:MAG: HU family DNA-binding protein [Erysipelotrichaceae bacterium]